ncbi:hypothetical protein FKB34_01900 [Glycocaulis profundi]|nr:hypothetical protein FKB34_01900 [Glycocaulis profundi]
MKAGRWSKAEEDRLRRLRVAQGLSVSACARELDRPKGAVSAKLSKLGLTTQEPRSTWTDDEIARLEALRAEGLTYADIGDILGRTSESCRSMAGNRFIRSREADPPAPEGSPALERALERLDRLTAAGMARTAALAMIEREMPDARLRGRVSC